MIELNVIKTNFNYDDVKFDAFSLIAYDNINIYY